MSAKTCFKCGAEKPLADFYKHPRMADGRLGKCKDCTKRDALEHRASNLESVRAYDRERYRTVPYRREQMRELGKRVRPANRVFSNAIRDGKVTRPEGCWHCGSPDRIEGHHVHYDLPLDVVWLCISCHRTVHRQQVLIDTAHKETNP